MSAAAGGVFAPEPHRIEVVAGVLVQTDGLISGLGQTRTVARCSCGWSVQRQLASAVYNQVQKHRREVAS